MKRLKARSHDLSIALALAALTAGVYGYGLTITPPNLAPDEVLIGNEAVSLATTGRGTRGHLLPLFFHVSELSWFYPMAIYATALILKFAPLTEVTLRMPTVIVAIVNIALFYFVCRQLHWGRLLSATTAVMLMLAPAHVIHGRYAMDYLYPVPFLLAWLLGIVRYLEHGSPKTLVWSSFVLGIGLYSYIAATLLMPIAYGITLVVLLQTKRPLRDYLYATGGFVGPVAVGGLWLAFHPEIIGQTIHRYELSEAAHLNPLQAAREFLSYTNIAAKTALYWDYLSPAFLFLDAAAPKMYSTRTTGVVLTGLAPLFVAGAYQLVTRAPSALAVVVMLGLLLMPIPATLVEERHSTNRVLGMVPFVILTAGIGLRWLWGVSNLERLRVLAWLLAGCSFAVGAGAVILSGRVTISSLAVLSVGAAAVVIAAQWPRLQVGRAVAIASLATMPLQFWSFSRDYLGDFRLRTSDVYPGNYQLAGERLAALAAEGASRLYVSGGLPRIDGYWRYFVARYPQAAGLQNAVWFDAVHHDFSTAPPEAIVFAKLDDPAVVRATADLTLAEIIPELGTAPARFGIYRTR